LGWVCQLFAVYTAMRAFDIHAPLPAAGLVLVLMNVATLFPLWPGNVGLVQAAVALPLSSYYAVAYGTGIAFGFGLQAIEASVGGEWHEAEVHDAFGHRRVARWLWQDGNAFVEAAEAIPLDPTRLDPMTASSRGLGELIESVGNPALIFVFLGGTATVDGGAG